MLIGYRRYFFPPGRYTLSYVLACPKDVFCYVVATTTCRDAVTGEKYLIRAKCWTLYADAKYHNYRFPLTLSRETLAETQVNGTAPFFLDGVVVKGDNYSLRAAGLYCPWPYMPAAGGRPTGAPPVAEHQ